MQLYRSSTNSTNESTQKKKAAAGDIWRRGPGGVATDSTYSATNSADTDSFNRDNMVVRRC